MTTGVSAATLTLGIETLPSRESLALLRKEIALVKGDLAGLAGGNLGSGLMRGVAEIKQGLSALLTETKLVNQQITDTIERGGKSAISAQKATNKTLLDDQRAYHRVSRALRDEAAKVRDEKSSAIAEQKAQLAGMLAARKSYEAEAAAASATFMKEWNAAQLALAKESEHAKTLMHKVAVLERLEDEKASATFMKEWNAAQLALAKESEHAKTLMHKVAVLERLEDEKAALAASRRLASYVGPVTTLGGYAAAAKSAPMVQAGAELSAMNSLQSQYAKTVGTVTEATTKSTGATKLWSAAHRDAHDAARGLSGALGGLWMTYGQMVPLMAGFAVASSLREAATAGKEFEYQMAFVKAVSGESARAIDGVGKALMGMAKDSMFSPVEMAKGMRVLAQAGMGTADALATLPSVMALATVGETDLATAVETATGVMHAFNMQVSDIGTIGDIIAKAAAVSVTSVESMSQSLKQASTVAQQYDLNIGEVSAALVALAQRNITGQAAGTAFRNMMNELSNPTDKARLMMDKVGISMYNSAGKARGLSDIMGQLRDKLKDYNSESQNVITSTMFGERGNKEAQAILAMTQGEWLGLIAKIQDSQGFLTRSMAELQNTVSGQFKLMANTLQGSLLQAFEASNDGLVELAKNLKSAFGSQEFVGAVRALGSAVMWLTNAVVEHVSSLAVLAGAYVAFHAARIAISGVVKVYETLKGAYVAATAASVIFTGASATQAAMLQASLAPGVMTAMRAVMALNAAMWANPVLAFAGAIGLLTAALLLLWDNTGKVDKATRAALDGVITATDLARKSTEQLSKQNDELERQLGLRKAVAVETADSIKSQLELGRRQASILEAQLGYTKTGRAGLIGSVVGGPSSAGHEGSSHGLAEMSSADRAVANAELAKLKIANAGLELQLLVAEKERDRNETLKMWEKIKQEDDRAKAGTKVMKPIEHGGGTGSVLSKYVKDVNADVANYSSTLSNIDSLESSFLALSKARYDAGLTSEKDYLKQREAIRSAADEAAIESNKQYVAAQEALGVDAAMAYKKAWEEGRAALGKATKDNQRESINREVEAALEQRVNDMRTAAANIDKANAELATHTETRTTKGMLDALAMIKENYGDTDKQIQNAQEMVRAIEVQTAAMMNLTTKERDKNIVAMEGDEARLKGLILAAEAGTLGAALTQKEIDLLKEKLGLLRTLMGQYSAQKAEQKALDDNWLLGAQAGLQKYAESTASAYKTAGDAVEKAFKGMEDAIVEFAMTGKLSVTGMVNSIIADLIRLGTRQYITQPLAAMLSGGPASIGSSLPSFAGSDQNILGSIASLFGFAKGDAFSSASTLDQYRNTIVTKPTTFAFAQGVMGEKIGSPGEAIMPLTRTSNGDLGVKVAADKREAGSEQPAERPIHVTVNISTPNPAAFQQSRGQVQNSLASAVRGAVRFA